MKIIKSRIFKALFLSILVGIILGIISFIIVEKKDIKTDLINYINLIKNVKFNYFNSLVNSLSSNLIYSFFIWIFGIIFILFFISLLIIIYKSISLGFMISGVVYTFKAKGVLYALILGLNSMINILIYAFLCYYSINFAIKTFNAFRNNRQISFKSFFINYIYIYLIIAGFLILSSFFEIYISSNLIRFVV